MRPVFLFPDPNARDTLTLITSPHNEKLKLVRRLAGRKARSRERLFVTEGEDLATAGIAAGKTPVFLLRPEGAEPTVDYESEPVASELLRRHSELGSGTRLIGVWEQEWREAEGPVCLYLDGVSDPGNVGTIIRTAHALVEGSVVIGARTADPHSPKAVRASMGSIFALPPARGSIQSAPEPRVGLVAHQGEGPTGPKVIADLPRPPLTVCVGAERKGVGAEVLAACGFTYSIPLRSMGAESLNAAVAAAICCERVSSPFVSDANG